MSTTITDSQIETLRTEAAAAGDAEQVGLCDRALDGDTGARQQCAEVIDDATAQDDAVYRVTNDAYDPDGTETYTMAELSNLLAHHGVSGDLVERDGEVDVITDNGREKLAVVAANPDHECPRCGRDTEADRIRHLEDGGPNQCSHCGRPLDDAPAGWMVANGYHVD